MIKSYYRVVEFGRLKSGICRDEEADKIKYFKTRYFAKRYYTKVYRMNEQTFIEEKFADEWLVLHTINKRR